MLLCESVAVGLRPRLEGFRPRGMVMEAAKQVDRAGGRSGYGSKLVFA